MAPREALQRSKIQDKKRGASLAVISDCLVTARQLAACSSMVADLCLVCALKKCTVQTGVLSDFWSIKPVC
jgi:uncharacterized protein YerC